MSKHGGWGYEWDCTSESCTDPSHPEYQEARVGKASYKNREDLVEKLWRVADSAKSTMMSLRDEVGLPPTIFEELSDALRKVEGLRKHSTSEEL